MKTIDLHSRRTIGLIAKPDTLFEDSESEKEFIKLVLNEATPFRLGWHLLRDRDFNTRDVTSIERHLIKEEFF